MSKFGTSQSVLRKEDVRFLTGTGRYLDEARPGGAAHAVFLRSPVAHGRITTLDTTAAAAAPGVLAVYVAADLEGQLQNALDFELVRNRDGSKGAAPRRPMLAEDRVRHLGEAVAMVVADSLLAAQDALELIVLDIDDLPVHLATAEGGPEIHPEAPGNVGYDWAFGDEAEVAGTFERAAHTTRLELIDNRVFAMPMEPRGCFAEWDGARLHVGFSGQGVWGLRDELVEKLGLAAEAVRVTTPDVGGGFGIKGCPYPEYFVVALAAMKLGRPVHWLSGRGEAMLSDNGCRDHVTVAEAAFDADYRLQAIRIECVSNLGAYNAPYGQQIASNLALKVMPGVYDVQQAFFHVKGVFTNTTPLDAYRGAGRPEAIYVIERLIDWSARDLGLDPVELRRHQLHPAARNSPTAASRANSTTSATSGACWTAPSRRPTSPASPRARPRAPAPASSAASASATTSNRSSATRTRRPPSPSPTTAWSSSASAPSRTARATRPPSPRSSSSAAACRSRRSASSRATATASPRAAAPAARARRRCRATRSTTPPTR